MSPGAHLSWPSEPSQHASTPLARHFDGTQLRLAAPGGARSSPEFLLQKKASVNAPTVIGATPLNVAMFGGSTECCGRPQFRGLAPAFVTCPTQDGFWASLTLGAGEFSQGRLLVAHSADVNHTLRPAGAIGASIFALGRIALRFASPTGPAAQFVMTEGATAIAVALGGSP